MAQYTERDYRDAERLREAIHKEALEKLRRHNPDINAVVDRYPLESYFSQYWDYPGAWYTRVGIPEEFKSRDDFVNAIVKDTLRYSYGKQK